MKKYRSIVLALLLFFTHVGFSTVSHYCGKSLVETDVVFISKPAEPCCPSSDKNATEKEHCCDIRITSLETGDALSFEFKVASIHFSSVLPYVPIVLFSKSIFQYGLNVFFIRSFRLFFPNFQAFYQIFRF